MLTNIFDYATVISDSGQETKKGTEDILFSCGVELSCIDLDGVRTVSVTAKEEGVSFIQLRWNCTMPNDG